MGFFHWTCTIAASINIPVGLSMLFRLQSIAKMLHSSDTAAQLIPESNPLVTASENLVGTVLASLGFLQFAVRNITEQEIKFKISVAGILAQLLLIYWRTQIARLLKELGKDWKNQLVGDCLFLTSWICSLFFE